MMSTLTVFYVKLLLVVVSSAVIWWGANNDSFWQKLQQNKQEKLAIWVSLILFRLIPFVLIYGVLQQMAVAEYNNTSIGVKPLKPTNGRSFTVILSRFMPPCLHTLSPFPW